MYSEKKLSQEQQNQLDQAEDEHDYVSGGPLLSADHPLFGTVVAEHGITCASHISANYFSSKICLPNCCYVCGKTEDLADASHLQGQFQTIHLVCEACAAKGRTPRTRGPKRKAQPLASDGKKKKTT